jgi:hypothetical protein
MRELKCPKCQSSIEIEDRITENENKTAIFCTNEQCQFHKDPLIGVDRGEKAVFISEMIY